MKSLMLGWELPPYNSGGLGVACYYLCQALAKRNVEIDFLVPYTEKHNVGFMNVISTAPFSYESIRRSGGAYESSLWKEQVNHVPGHGPGDLYSQTKFFAEFTRHYVRKQKVDVIHAHDWLTFEAGVAAKRITGRPLIAHVHATEFDRSGEFHGNPLVHEIEELALHEADRIVAVSQLTKNLIAKNYHIPADKIDVIHNGLDPEQLSDPADATSYQYLLAMKQLGYKVVVNVGRLTVQKGLRYLLEAAAKAISKNPKIIFLIVGSGEQRDELIRLSADLGISENVIFTGFQRGTPLRDAFAIGDLFVMPSVSEPFGLTALEAIALGSPVLLSHTCGVGEIAKNMLKVDYWDTTAMADKMVMVLEEQSLHDELLRGGQYDLERMPWAKAAERCAEMYRTMTNTGAMA